MSFAGLIARRAIGENKGYALAGLFGGIVSSTLVTLNFARESRSEPGTGRALALGVIAACTVLPVRVAILTTIVNRQIGIAVLPYLAIAFVAGLLLLLFIKKEHEGETAPATQKNPLRLFAAIQMVVIFQIALFAFYWVRQRFGSAGVLVSSAIAGFTDVDTLIFMIGKQPELAVDLAVSALVIGVIANTFLKLLMTIVIGKGTFRRTAAFGLSVLAISLIASMIF
jgi:uncharacterized membrane protein (DUF4010 family)